MRVLICGSRSWSNTSRLWEVMAWLPDNAIVIHGGCRGADLIAADTAKKFGMVTVEYKADWAKHGNAAGPIRNQQMLDDGKPDLVIAFAEDVSVTRGTADMVRRSKAAGLPVLVVQSTDSIVH